jgi:hypothetical protein
MPSVDYVTRLQEGPFAGVVDPWAEHPRYFQQIHSGMINGLLQTIQVPLLERGYIAGKKTSLQILEGRQPDVFVRVGQDRTATPSWDYAQAASTVMLDAGVEAEQADLEAVHIREQDTQRLVTVIEIISPANKDESYLESYRQRRAQTILSQGINLVEVDATRSVKRVLEHHLTHQFPYHTAVYLPGARPRLLLSEVLMPLKDFALPLRAEVIPIHLQPIYDAAYRTAAIAGHIVGEGGYTSERLPFPSLVTAGERTRLEAAVQRWQAALDQATGDG